MILTGRYQIPDKKLSDLLVMDLVEHIDKFDVTNWESPFNQEISNICKLEGYILDVLPKGVDVGDNLDVVGPRLTATLRILHSSGEVRSNGVYKLITHKHSNVRNRDATKS